MKVAIMQPYFLPYIGYFQLIHAVDEFILYDNIQYTKKGWINRNRFLRNNTDVMFTLPVKKDSDYLNVNERYICASFNRGKLLSQIKMQYRKAPYYDEVFSILEKIINHEESNLFKYIYFSLQTILLYLEIHTPIIVSSIVSIDHSLKNKDKVVSLCKNRNASEYINPIGGKDLYDKNFFSEQGIELKFLQANLTPYQQLGDGFIEGLSILDVMMFNSKEDISLMLNEYKLL